MERITRRFDRTRLPERMSITPAPRPAMTAQDELLTPEAAAILLGCAAATLAKWRCLRSDGPRYIKLGARTVRYPASELRAWIARQDLRTHTHWQPTCGK